ncbi:MAG: energy coupling factor transporter S component ThiW [Peptococcaceae bacterium]
MATKKLTFAALLIAIGTLLGHVIYIPVGVAKCFPIQHAINVISAVLLGPGYAVSNAFVISLLRNILGTGSPLAFPGSMLGAFLAGLLFTKTGKYSFTVAGEIFGTGILGGIASYPIAKFILGNDVAVFFFVVPFLVSTIGGSLIGYLLLKILANNPWMEKQGFLRR